MNININFYGYSVDIDPQDILDRLDDKPTKKQIKEKLDEMIQEAIMEDFPGYQDDGEDVVEAALKLSQEMEEES